MTSPQVQRREVAEYSHLVHERGWVANHDGNVSLRLTGGDGFLITPTAMSKRGVTPQSVVLCSASGEPQGRGRPPSEIALHVGAYRTGASVRAVIHAHPPHASAFALAGRKLDPVGMPEVVISLGERIPLLPVFVPKDPAVAEAVATALATASVVLLAGNGVIAVGRDLEQAYLRLELVEHYAKIFALALPLGGPAPLEPTVLRSLAALRPGTPPSSDAPPKTPSADRIRPLIVEEIRRAFGGGQ